MTELSFPENFMWGAATSSHQVEGNNFFNDWWKWEQNGNTPASLMACDHYTRFKEDFLLAKKLGHNAHRLSLEWSRLEKRENVWDQNEWNHYKSVLDELNKLGITPIVTLNHFTLPLWFAQKGAWLNPNSIEIFTRFAEKCIQELGRKVQYWITINEPHILAFLAYYYADWPPCKKNFNDALLALRNMIKSHAKIYTLFHDYAAVNPHILTPKIGIAKAVTAFHPCRQFSLFDRISTYFRSWMHNYSSVSSLIKGKILIPGLPKEKLNAKNTLDFIGLNYYFRQFIHYKKLIGEVCDINHHPNAGETSDMGWEIYPEGIYETVKSFSRYKIPIMITENGIATNNDSTRTAYIKNHLLELLKNINEGAPVIGYMHWSLLDNFEWAEGYSKRFGLIHVDYETQTRTIKDSALYYAQIIKTGEIK